MYNSQPKESDQKEAAADKSQISPPTISLPKGGGAIRGIGEKFAANPVTGTGSMSVPLATSPGRSGFGPQLSLSYDSGAGNGPFGLGWSLSLPQITRKTDKGLPKYQDAPDSDIFILSGAEDLVPVYKQAAQGNWEPEVVPPRTVDGVTYIIHRYRPRIEGLFARIERWMNQTNPADVFWRSITKDNLTTFYGKTAESRIADPNDPQRIFSWLICQSYDDKGNALIYQYAAEAVHGVDQTQVNERNRTRPANRYLKRIKYGNHTPNRDPQGKATDPTLLPDDTWMFELVFDYGEGHFQPLTTAAQAQQFVTAQLRPPTNTHWPARQDPFSSYRSGFEVRTYRLCRRTLMFHHFPEELGSPDYLVSSTEFSYSEGPVASFVTTVTQSGYVRPDQNQPERYLRKSLPPLEFTYSQVPTPQELATRPIHDIDAASLENLPIGLDGVAYQWVDLDGEGLSGLLTDQGNAWFYKCNTSANNLAPENGNHRTVARFAPVERVATRPTGGLQGGQAQFMDLAGDGRPDLVLMAGPASGFYERTLQEDWEPFRSFSSWPNVDTRDPNLKFIDLDGDGHADLLITEHDAFTWHPSLAEDGFGPAQRIFQPWDEEKGPRLVFADAAQSIYLADLSGDGLTDLVRLRNGEVSYWPNLGYGHFGAKVTMDNAPRFDAPDGFDQKRIRLADIDGSGVTDILYLGGGGVRIYLNQSGNSWSAAQTLSPFPRIDDLSSVQVVDLLGNGTACLVWSSPLPGDARQPMRYLDLMGGEKPHLLVKTINNLGLETEVQYAPSTRFYLQDKYDGKPWLTRLPFPVHCVEKVTVRDTWRKTTFSTSYSYHHGYFDGPEREFRGFGRVEQVDVEAYGEFAAGNTNSPYITGDKMLYQPPVKTVTWFHTGAFLDRERVLNHFAHEYFPNWFEDLQPGQQVLGDFRENHLLEPDLDPPELTLEEWREALRACKGMTLRQEVYELDVDELTQGKHKPVKLFSTAYHNCHIQRLQPQADNRHAVFLVTESEAITYHYELDLGAETLMPDPRIAHTLNLKIDDYGNIQQAVSVVYPRLGQRQDETLPTDAGTLIQSVQRELHLAYSETRYTNDVIEADSYRLRLPYEVLTYELTGIGTEDASDEATADEDIDNRYFTLDELRAFKLSESYQTTGMAVEEIAYHLLPNPIAPQKRLVEHARTLFFEESLDKPLLLGRLNALALPYESYKLALTAELLSFVFKDKLTTPVQSVLSEKQSSGYLSGADLAARFGDNITGQYWLCSGVAGFNADAPQHFYLPERYTDPFGNPTTLSYDPRDLFIQSSTDALGNQTEVTEFDFRVLAPRKLKDINNNLSEVRFDGLGMPIAMAMLGKGNEGDNLSGFDEAALNPELATLIGFFVSDDYSAGKAKALLGNASSHHLYYFGEIIQNGKTLWGQHPPCAGGIVREQHVAQQPDSPVQTAFEYSDGAGNVLVSKVQAEPEQPGGALCWVASGKTILNNKGKPVKQYEPYFSPPAVGHRFEEPAEVGVTPVLYYDAVGRVIRTESPDGSYSHVEFSPWHVTSFDQNDTAYNPDPSKRSDWYLRRTDSTHSRFVDFNNPQDRRAAELVEMHANTPLVTFLDSLGREVVSVAHNRSGPPDALVDEKHVTFTKLDAEGKPLWIRDARKNLVMQYITPIKPARADDEPDPTHPERIPEHTVPCYDIAGNLLFQHSMDAGERWLLNDAAGKPMFAWDSRGFITQAEYDELHRPTALIVTDKEGHVFAAERTVYGETAFGPVKTDAAARDLAQQTNHLGQLYQVYDEAGIVTNVTYDFKGNLRQGERRLLRDYAVQVNWPALQSPPQALSALLENERFASRIRYDALNRPIQLIAPHSTAANPPRINVAQPGYNEAGLLERMEVWLNHTTEPTELLDPATANQPIVTNINYNAKGQRLLISYGNGVTTSYDYEPETFQLKRLRTTRSSDGAVLQDLNYTYDPVGNIMQIRDNAQDSVFHNNQVVLPGGEYRYDALYRLMAAGGREHKGNEQQVDWDDSARVVNMLPNDGQALQNYVERYSYDGVGNLMQMIHHTGRDLEQPGPVIWNRRYQYALDSNRLLATSLPGEEELPAYVAVPGYNAPYTYDLHGNMKTMPHLPLMQWDDRDQLQATTQQVVHNGGTPEMTWYVYDAAGQRVRKVTERQAAAGQTPTRRKERIYLGGFEIYREYQNDGDTVTLERTTLHIMDDKQRIALVETRTHGNEPDVPAQLIRYQFGNHLGSASLELDDQAQIISYEEYTPYGSTSYQAGRSAAEVSLKRYRYTGKERDEETGFSYHGARYYVPWLGKWASPDPAALRDGINLYVYVRCNPIYLVDLTGTDGQPFTDAELEKIESRIRTLETMWLYGLADPLQTNRVLTGREIALIEDRIPLLQKVRRLYDVTGSRTDASIVAHLEGDLRSRLLINKRMKEIEPAREQAEQATGKSWLDLSDSAKRYWKMKIEHPEWQVRPNMILDMTGSIVKESQSTDVQVFQGAIIGSITGLAMSPKPTVRASPPPSTGPVISLIRAFIGTRQQFRNYVLAKLQREPNNPLRFLLNASGTDFKRVTSRAHSELINNPDIWEAGHIVSDKIGGNRLMIQSAWENQVQNITVEHSRVGGAVLGNPAVEVGGFPVAKSTVLWWEQAGHLPAGTAANAPVIQ